MFQNPNASTVQYPEGQEQRLRAESESWTVIKLIDSGHTYAESHGY